MKSCKPVLFLILVAPKFNFKQKAIKMKQPSCTHYNFDRTRPFWSHFKVVKNVCSYFQICQNCLIIFQDMSKLCDHNSRYVKNVIDLLLSLSKYFLKLAIRLRWILCLLLFPWHIFPYIKWCKCIINKKVAATFPCSSSVSSLSEPGYIIQLGELG